MNMLSSVAPWDLVAEGYSEVTMKLFQQYAEEAIAMAGIDSQSHVLDVACGPGTLTLDAARTAEKVTAIDFSQAMINILHNTIKTGSIANIEAHCGDGQALPFKDESFDAAFSMFGLMFFPDRMRGYKEIYRTLKPGGKTIISSWTPTQDSSVMMAMFGALRAINPDIPEPQTDIASLENPDVLETEMKQAGFTDVNIKRVSKGLSASNATEFWQDMVKGSAPIVMMKNNMPDDAWQEKSKIAIGYIEEHFGDRLSSLSADAWFGIGTI
jgi:ubiquinone/menaquinone biosynthesis C-methylase UbiE